MSSGTTAPGPRTRSVRHRLLAIALVPMLLILPVLLGIGIWSWMRALDELKISKVADDLTIARQYLQKLTEDEESGLTSVSDSYRFHQALSAGDDAALSRFLHDEAGRNSFDFLYLVDDHGRPVAGAPLAQDAERRWDWPVIAAALQGGSHVGLDVFSREDLMAIAPELADRARIELVPQGAAETRGLVLHSASSVPLPDGGHAALVAGVLLNNNLGFVDRINDLLYHGPGLLAGSLGTVTLFLDDVRISTNVRLFEGRRAIGTRVSDEVRRAVLGEGRTWLDSAFVVNDRFVSGYEPLLDTYGGRIGMLYVGYLERPITEVKLNTTAWTFVALVIAAAVTVPIFLLWAASIFRPLERINHTITRIENGELDARTHATGPIDEIGRVANRFDELLDRVQDRETSLRELNGQLSMLSEQRAAALREKSSQLETTIEQLVMSEKLATIGQITASIAHEVNNPVAIMQGNLEILRDQLGPAASDAETELDLLDQQLRRMKEIIDRLLLFAKPHDYAPTGPVAPETVFSETIPFVQHVLQKGGVRLQTEYRSSRTAAVNRVELQQVFVNLLINAAQAMPKGGPLTARIFDQDRNGKAGIAIEVADTGTGMTPEIAERIFEPFFTTKGSDGNGLGLAISRMLVERQGGELTVRSVEREGSAFTVWLPATSVA